MYYQRLSSPGTRNFAKIFFSRVSQDADARQAGTVLASGSGTEQRQSVAERLVSQPSKDIDMAKPSDTSKPHSRGKRFFKAQAVSSSAKPAKSAKAAASPADLEGIVEDERARLMRVHSILSCMIAAMEDEGVCTGDGPYWPAVIETACDLINESIRRLEDLDYSAKPVSRKGYVVREPVFDFGNKYWARTALLSTRDCEDAPERRVSGHEVSEPGAPEPEVPEPGVRNAWRSMTSRPAGSADIVRAFEYLLKMH